MPREVKHTSSPGEIVLVSGELGSGKTTFVRGACRALGIEGPVTSPTFTIGQVLGGDPEIAHLDLYRLGSLAGEDPGLLEDYLTPQRVGFVEWPELADPAHARELMPAVASAMEMAGARWEDLEAIAVGVGPGTFTGLRIGIATARALATANELPLRRVSSLAALAAGIRENAAAALALPLIDARRGEVFAALYDGPEAAWPPV